MGVSGLWDLLSPVGYRVSNEHVQNKVLAVDVSIWLTQFIKAMRDSEGATLRNAHLLGVFRRCLKLLFLSVRPVLIFDGETPALKRRTLAMRSAVRERHAAKLRRLAEKLLVNQLKQSALAHVVSRTPAGRRLTKKSASSRHRTTPALTHPDPLSKAAASAPNPTSTTTKTNDVDEITPVHPEKMPTAPAGLSSNSVKEGIENNNSHDENVLADLSDDDEPVGLPADLDLIDDDTLLGLPANMQSKVLKQIKVHHRAQHREHMLRQKNDPAAFSRAQINGFLRNTALNRRISSVRNAINVSTGASQRIASDSSRAFVLDEVPQNVGDDADLDLADSASEDELVSGQPKNFDAAGGPKGDILSRIRKKNDQRMFGPGGIPPSRSSANAGQRSDKSGVGWAAKALGRAGGFVLGEQSLQHMSSTRDGEDSHESERDNDFETYNVAGHLPVNDEPVQSVLPNASLNQGDSSDDDIEWEDGAADDVEREPVLNIALADKTTVPGSKSAENDDLVKTVQNSAMDEDDANIMLDIDSAGEPESVPGANSLGNVDSDTIQHDTVERSDPNIMVSNAASGELMSETHNEISEEPEMLDLDDDVHQGVPDNRESANDAKLNTLSRTDNRPKQLGRNTISDHKTMDEEERDVQLALAFSIEHKNEKRNIAQHEGEETYSPTKRDFAEPIEEDKELPLEAFSPLDDVAVAASVKPSASQIKGITKQDFKDNEEDQDLQIALALSLKDKNEKVVAMRNDKTESADNPKNGLEHPKASKTRGPDEDSHEVLSENVNEEDVSMKRGRAVPLEERISELEAPDSSEIQPAEASAQNSRLFVNSQRAGGAEVAQSTGNVDKSTDQVGLSPEDIGKLQGELQAEAQDIRKKKVSHQSGLESVSDEMYAETRDLLKLFGIPYLQAPMEAEAQCAYLDLKNVVDGIITEDSDAFLFGANSVYRQLFSEGKFAEVYDIKDVSKSLGLSRDDLIRLAYLLGSDYTSGVRGVGVVNAMEILEAFPGEDGLKEFREWTKKVTVLDEEPDEETMKGTSLEAVRRQFCWKHRNMKRNWEIRDGFPNPAVLGAYMRPEVDRSTDKFKWGKINFEGLAAFCWEKFGWEYDRFENAVGPLRKKLKDREGQQQQRRIDEFFKPHRFAKIRSERLQRAVKGIVGDEAEELMAQRPPKPPPKRKRNAVAHIPQDIPSEEEAEMVKALEQVENSRDANPAELGRDADPQLGRDTGLGEKNETTASKKRRRRRLNSS